MTWRASKTEGKYELIDESGIVLDSIAMDHSRRVYVNCRGAALDVRFDRSREAVEKAAAGLEPPTPEQGRLAL